MNAIQRYELIRPILKHEKTPKQVSEETNIPISTIYRYLKRYRESGGDIESLADKSHANQSHPKWLERKDKDKNKASRPVVDLARHNRQGCLFHQSL